MTTHKKGLIGCNWTTFTTHKQTCDFTNLGAHIKAAIVTLALWGLLPVALADWLINRGETHDE
jgi:hypothetical protein